MDKTKLLDRLGASGEERLLLAKVLDRLEQSQNRNISTSTDFLSPEQQARVRDLLHVMGVAEDRWTAFGGFEGAERVVVLFLPDWLDAADAESPLRFLRAAYRPEFQLTHRDFLGSLMGLGIVREKVGDLLVGPESADLVVLDSVAEFLLQSWDSAGRAHLRLSAIKPEEIRIPQVRCEEIRTTVSSLRLDAIVSSGFQMARGKAAGLIEGGKVQVNWRECAKPDKLLAEGDTVSARGYGKFELSTVGGVTRKGRTSIVLKRYI